jgi:hypothetical protein
MKLTKEEIALIKRISKREDSAAVSQEAAVVLLAMKRFVMDNTHKINQLTSSTILNKNFYSVYIPGMKKFMR